MKLRNIILILIGFIVGIAYIIIANSIKTTETIWLFARAYGLIAIFLLFILVLIGEFRLLGFNKLFKVHCLIGILTLYVVFLHFISAVFDKFKWGKNLRFIDYLGFNFSDKWMVFMSLGAIAGYLIILLSITSSRNNIKKLSFRNWKKIHYLSYAVLLFVFLHSIILGTDIKTSSLRVFFFPLVFFVFFTQVGFLGIRLAKKNLLDRKEMILSIFLVILLAIGIAFFANHERITKEKINSINIEKEKLAYDVGAINNNNQNLINQINYIQKSISQISNQSDSFSRQIAEKKSAAEIPPITTNEDETIANSIVYDDYEYGEEDD